MDIKIINKNNGCCKCGKKQKQMYLLGNSPFKKFLHCQKCYKIIYAIDSFISAKELGLNGYNRTP